MSSPPITHLTVSRASGAVLVALVRSCSLASLCLVNRCLWKPLIVFISNSAWSLGCVLYSSSDDYEGVIMGGKLLTLGTLGSPGGGPLFSRAPRVDQSVFWHR